MGTAFEVKTLIARVYKSGFATTQKAYENNVFPLFKSLDRLEEMLSKSSGKYLLGNELTEADIRLYVTIIRFDPVYVQHFKCNIGSIRHKYSWSCIVR
jgi:putative glutathione S-transferase